MIVGSGRFRYRVNADWAKLPEGWSFKEVGESARPADYSRSLVLPEMRGGGRALLSLRDTDACFGASGHLVPSRRNSDGIYHFRVCS